jgi:hypothetical protein
MVRKIQPQRKQYVIFGGGLDLVTPPLQVDPGRAVNAKNFEADVSGGYRMMRGLERADGRNSPTRSPWSGIAVEDGSAYVTGELVLGEESGACGILILATATALYLVSVEGDFAIGESLKASSAESTSTSLAFQNITVDDDTTRAAVRFLKEEYFKAFIEAVPGIGPVRGVHRHFDKLYAMRDIDATECGVYVDSAAGWVRVPFGDIIFFDTGLAALADNNTPGTVINDGLGNDATIEAVVLETIGGVEGYMVVSGYTAGFAVTNAILQGATPLATVSESATPWVQAPAGRYESFSHNFFSSAATTQVHSVDGVNPAFVINPDRSHAHPVYTDQTNRSTDTPTFSAPYKSHWFVGYARGLLRNSEPNNPELWDAASGSLEIAVGAAVSGFDTTPQSLTVATRRITYVLVGNTIDDFVFSVSSAKTGGAPYTLQHIGTTYMLDDRGVIELSRVQAFGNFENATVSRKITPLLTRLRASIVASTVSRANNVYRLIASDGRGLSMTLQEGDVIGFTEFDIERGVSCASNQEDETGAERSYIGSTDGFVYEWDVGQSYDGDEIERWLQPVNHFLESPTTLKRFYRAFIDTVLDGRATILIYAELASGSAAKQTTLTQTKALTGLESAWDIGLWDEAVFDAKVSTGADIDLTGSGDSISLIFYNKSATDDPLILKDVVYHYKPRRMLRGSQ